MCTCGAVAFSSCSPHHVFSNEGSVAASGSLSEAYGDQAGGLEYSAKDADEVEASAADAGSQEADVETSSEDEAPESIPEGIFVETQAVPDTVIEQEGMQFLWIPRGLPPGPGEGRLFS
ncbi:unnamed protein product [Prorocentrum cordatum]|uniref:Uncharacterized protein n=1 Tax=Prorocentrum cordatum TaxID=2364126 RepID=A0ABN9TPS7_9DINO|nr:unnamed protein product [Polarella glacialis]